MDRNATLRWILERDEVFRYQLLSRMKMDSIPDRVYEVNMG